MGDERPVQWRSHNVSRSLINTAAVATISTLGGESQEDRSVVLCPDVVPLLTIALIAAICFSVVSFIIGRGVKPRQL